MFSPSFVSDARLGFTRLRHNFLNALQSTRAAAAIGIANVNNPAVSWSGGLPVVSITGFANLGESNILPLNVAENNFQYGDNLIWIKGAHSIKFGGVYIRRQMNFYQANNQRGNFSFDGSFTSQPGVGNTGSAFGDLLLGYPITSTLAVINNEVGQRNFESALYVEDTWKVNTKLTLTFGLRYEFVTPRVEVADRQANFDPTVAGGAVVLASTPNAPCGRALRCTDTTDFAPRFGFA